jgi:cell division protein FtsB
VNPKKNHHSRRTFLPEVRRSSRLAFVYGLLLGLSVLAICIGFAMWGPKDNFVQHIFSTQEVAELNEQLAALELQTSRLQEEVERTNELAKLDKEARSKLNLLIANLESENAKLKEDLAFFEGFMPGSLQGAISLKRLQVTKDTVPDQYRYKALVIQGSQRPEVKLNVQVLIKVLDKDTSSVIVLPSADAIDDPQFNIKLTRFSRVSGVFSLPQGSKLQSVEMRILDSGAIRAQSTIKL